MDGEDGSHIYRQHFERDACFRFFYFKGEKVLKLTPHVLFLLLLSGPACAQSVVPKFTQGSMQSTSTTVTTIDRVINTEVMGGTYSSWSGTNITASGDPSGDSTTFSITDTAEPWQLEITSRDAGVIETIDITESIDQTTTTTSLSIFSQ